MNLLIPLKIRCNCKLDLESGPGHGLNGTGEFNLGQAMEETMNGLSQFRRTNQFTQLERVQVKESVEAQGLFLNFLHNFLWDFFELPERAHGLPHSSVNHLGQG